MAPLTVSRENAADEPADPAMETLGRPLVGWITGLEPAASGTTIRRSNHLSYIHRAGVINDCNCLEYQIEPLFREILRPSRRLPTACRADFQAKSAPAPPRPRPQMNSSVVNTEAGCDGGRPFPLRLLGENEPDSAYNPSQLVGAFAQPSGRGCLSWRSQGQERR